MKKHDPQPLKASKPQTGVVVWKNPHNKFLVFELHYTADPAKRDPSFIAPIRAAMPLQQFNMEYEKSWDAYTGMPVYPDFSESRHLLEEQPEPWIGLPLMRGWDFGLTPACVVAQLQASRLVIFREFTAVNMGAEQFCSQIMPQMAQLYPGAEFYDFADPAGVAKAQSDERTCFEVLATFGVTPIPGPVAWEERRQGVEHFLVKRTREGEAFGIWEPDCRQLLAGFKGGYRYPEKASSVEPDKLRPIKDRYSHPHDALQYIAACIRRGGLRRGTSSIPTTNYFQGASR